MFLKSLKLSLLTFILSGCSSPLYTNLNNAELEAMIKQGVPVYDVRRTEEWKQTGVIEGSKLLTIINKDANINPEFIPEFTHAIDKDKPVILICRTGNRTRKLSTLLTEQYGYTKVYNVRNSITQWIKDGNAITQVTL